MIVTKEAEISMNLNFLQSLLLLISNVFLCQERKKQPKSGEKNIVQE